MCTEERKIHPVFQYCNTLKNDMERFLMLCNSNNKSLEKYCQRLTTQELFEAGGSPTPFSVFGSINWLFFMGGVMGIESHIYLD